MRQHCLRILAAISLLGFPVHAVAHLSFSAHFRMDGFMEVEGRVTEIRWAKLHVRTFVEDASGEAREVEAGSASLLLRMGIEQDAFTRSRAPPHP